MSRRKKIEFCIEITSDWAIVEFKGASLTNIKIIDTEGKVKRIKIEDNKIHLIPFLRKKDGVAYLKLKFSSLVESNKKIESVAISKGDAGKVDVEINGQHFINLLNILGNSSNYIELKVNIIISKMGKKPKTKLKSVIVPVKREKKAIVKKEMIKYPSILIVTPTKNDAHYLSRHLKQWEKVDYPREKIRWVWIYGESKDDTEKFLDKYFSSRKWNCEIYSEPRFKNLIPDSAMWIADIMNSARKLYKGEDFVILDDSDIVEISPMVLKELVSLDLDMVAPYVWHDGRINDFFDTYVFRDLNGVKYPIHNVPHMDKKEPIELGSAGTMLLIRGKIFDTIEFENPCPTLQFCKNARKRGYKVWAAPWVEIFHADVTKEMGECRLPPEYYIEAGILPISVLEMVK